MRDIRIYPVICRPQGHIEQRAAEWDAAPRVTRSALDLVATETKLREAWKDLWRHGKNQTSTGVDGETVQQFAAALKSRLDQTLRQLQLGYGFSALRGIPLPKPNSNKKRIICIPTVQDRLVQRLLGEHLWRKADALGIVNAASFGFVRGRGVTPARDAAVAIRAEHPWAYKSDIVAFFDRIDRGALVRDVARCLKQRSLMPMLAAAASCEIDTSEAAVSRVVAENGIKRGFGVRQGMPLSPLFANIALRKFDAEMVRRGFRMVRYADDFVVFCNSRLECEEVDRVVRASLANLRHDIPLLGMSGKTRIAAPNEPIEFLGLALTPHECGYRLIITRDQVEKLNRDLCKLKDLDFLRNRGVHVGSLTTRIDARIGGLRAAYNVASNFKDLDRLLVTARRDILREVYVKGFGEQAVRNLPQKYNTVFGLG